MTDGKRWSRGGVLAEPDQRVLVPGAGGFLSTRVECGELGKRKNTTERNMISARAPGRQAEAISTRQPSH